MQPTHLQPHASPISDDLVHAILADTIDDCDAREFAIRRHGEFSNDLAVVTLASGRRLMVKRGRHPWSGEGFANARRAAHLLRDGAGIVVPEPLDLSRELAEEPVEAYWRIELPLFADVWSDLGEREREAAMRSLGILMRQVHGARVTTDTRLRRKEAEPFSIDQLLDDLSARLFPAIAGEWPDALELLELLIERAPRTFSGREAGPVVLHGDLHLGNVLCRNDGRGLRCVGLLDLEWVHSGPAESDFGRLQVMHSGPFDMPIEPRYLEHVYGGYEGTLDSRLLMFYSLYHLLNLGLYSAVIGDSWHAGMVAAAAREVATEL